MNAKEALRLSRKYSPESEIKRLIAEAIEMTENSIQAAVRRGDTCAECPTCEESEEEVHRHFQKLGYRIDNRYFIYWD